MKLPWILFGLCLAMCCVVATLILFVDEVPGGHGTGHPVFDTMSSGGDGAALFISISKDDLVALLGAFGWGTFAAALVPTVAIGFNWKRATATAVNVAIASSLLINFGVQFLNISIPFGIHEGAIALLVSLTLFFGISLASPPPKLDADIAAIMDL
ncbi:MAG: hypothetical protein IID08_02900 [Candidatus Hydrogenedentes bacterium]|nr:hypothetical protein [Candidatus Hydrogenedentota bacterium]